MNGEAHRNAEVRQLEARQTELEREKKINRDQISQKARGKTALDKERQLRERQKELEEEIRRIERKKQVFQEESKLAHDNAANFVAKETP